MCSASGYGAACPTDATEMACSVPCIRRLRWRPGSRSDERRALHCSPGSPSLLETPLAPASCSRRWPRLDRDRIGASGRRRANRGAFEPHGTRCCFGREEGVTAITRLWSSPVDRANAREHHACRRRARAGRKALSVGAERHPALKYCTCYDHIAGNWVAGRCTNRARFRRVAEQGLSPMRDWNSSTGWA